MWEEDTFNSASLLPTPIVAFDRRRNPIAVAPRSPELLPAPSLSRTGKPLQRPACVNFFLEWRYLRGITTVTGNSQPDCHSRENICHMSLAGDLLRGFATWQY